MITVIVPVYNAPKHLSSLLTKLRSQTIRDYELIVVDSSSKDNTTDVASSYGARIITIPKSEFDHGGTRTMAAMQAKGDILVYLTQDALPCNEYTIENLIAPFENDPKVAATFGKQFDARLLLPESLKYHFQLPKGFAGNKDIFMLISSLYANKFLNI